MTKAILDLIAGLGTALAWSSPRVCYGTPPRIYGTWLVVSAGFVALLFFGDSPAGAAGDVYFAAKLAWMAAFVHILIRFIQRRRGTLPWPPPESRGTRG